MNRETQYVEGLQLVFTDALEADNFLKNYATKYFSKRMFKGRDETLNKTKAHLVEFKGGLTICWCEDKMPRGYKGEIYITVPYILVDGIKRDLPECLWQSTDPVLLEDFIKQYWIGNPEPIKPKTSRITKSVSGLFPQVLADLVCTLEEFYLLGLEHKSLDNKEIQFYEMSCELNLIVANILKEEDAYYDYLKRIDIRLETCKFHETKYQTVVELLHLEKPKIYEFMLNRNYFNAELDDNN
jgi:hypothetical protein